MRLLLQAGKRNLSKSAILSHIWGLESNAVENHVEVYVAILRKKLSSMLDSEQSAFHYPCSTPTQNNPLIGCNCIYFICDTGYSILYEGT